MPGLGDLAGPANPSVMTSRPRIIGFGLIAFAIYKRNSVKASFKLWSVVFSLEAKNEDPKNPIIPRK
jgi:hypothetical protein